MAVRKEQRHIYTNTLVVTRAKITFARRFSAR
jgi:hypothetical protein